MNFLQITSNDLGYGGVHHGTYTIDEKGIETLKELLQEAYNAINGQETIEVDELETLDKLDMALLHIHEHIDD